MTPFIQKRLDRHFAEMPALVAEAVPAREVREAEALLGVTFSDDYRQFVERYGGGVVGSLPVLGLRQAEVMGDDMSSVVEVTNRFRSDGWKPTGEWAVVSVDLAGNPIGLAADGSVWISDHDVGEVRKLADTFEEFLRQQLNE